MPVPWLALLCFDVSLSSLYRIDTLSILYRERVCIPSMEKRDTLPLVQRRSLSPRYTEECLPCPCPCLALQLACPCLAPAYALPSILLSIDEMSLLILSIEGRDPPGKARRDMAKLALLCLGLPLTALTSLSSLYRVDTLSVPYTERVCIPSMEKRDTLPLV